MPAMTKEQYHAAGRKAGAAGDPPARLKPGTWQAAAYNRGYVDVPLDATAEALAAAQAAAGTRRLVGMPARQIGKSVLATLSPVEAMSRGWPRAARQHALHLAEDLARERRPERRERLQRALRRMAKRHGMRADPLSVPMTTQPYPEGPVTVRDILQGR